MDEKDRFIKVLKEKNKIAVAECRRHITGQLLTLIRLGLLERTDANEIDDVIDSFLRKDRFS